MKKNSFNLKRYLQAQDYSQTQPPDSVQNSPAAKVKFTESMDGDFINNEPEFRDLSKEDRQLWINPTLREKIKNEFTKKHPHIAATIKQMIHWYKKNFDFKYKFDYDFKNRSTDLKL